MNKKFRKAIDANAMVIFAAIGVIVVVGMYYLSRSTMKSVANSQTGMGTAMEEGLDKLKR